MVVKKYMYFSTPTNTNYPMLIRHLGYSSLDSSSLSTTLDSIVDKTQIIQGGSHKPTRIYGFDIYGFEWNYISDSRPQNSTLQMWENGDYLDENRAWLLVGASKLPSLSFSLSLSLSLDLLNVNKNLGSLQAFLSFCSDELCFFLVHKLFF